MGLAQIHLMTQSLLCVASTSDASFPLSPSALIGSAYSIPEGFGGERQDVKGTGLDNKGCGDVLPPPGETFRQAGRGRFHFTSPCISHRGCLWHLLVGGREKSL